MSGPGSMSYDFNKMFDAAQQRSADNKSNLKLSDGRVELTQVLIEFS